MLFVYLSDDLFKVSFAQSGGWTIVDWSDVWCSVIFYATWIICVSLRSGKALKEKVEIGHQWNGLTPVSVSSIRRFCTFVPHFDGSCFLKLNAEAEAYHLIGFKTWGHFQESTCYLNFKGKHLLPVFTLAVVRSCSLCFCLSSLDHSWIVRLCSTAAK